MATYIFTIRDEEGSKTFGSDQLRNWAEIITNRTRNGTYNGIVRDFTNTFEFVDEIKARCLRLLDNYGTDTQMFLQIYEGNDNHESKSYKEFGGEMKANFSKPTIDELTFQLNFIDSSFQEKLLGRDNTKVNYATYESLDGEVISEFNSEYIPASFHDRTIEDDSLLIGNPNKTRFFQNAGGQQVDTFTLPLTVDYKSDDAIQTVPAVWSELQISPAFSLYYNGDQEKRLQLTAEIDIDLTYLGTVFVENPSKIALYIDTISASGSVDSWLWAIKEDLPLIAAVPVTLNFTASVRYYATIEKGGSHRFRFEIQNESGTTGNIQVQYLEFQDNGSTFQVESTDYYKEGVATTGNVIRPHHLFTRLAQIYTGEQLPFYSTLFGTTEDGYTKDGKWAYLCACTGKMIRGFPWESTQLNTSLRDAFTAYNCIEKLGAAITYVNGVKVFRIEKYDELFDTSSILDLGSDVTDVIREIDQDSIFTEYNYGYGDLEYEEVNGLGATHGEFGASSPLKVKDKKYDIVCKWIADQYAIEFERRKQYEDNPTLDSKRDDKIFLVHMHYLNGVLQAKKNEDFVEITGVPNPQLIYNAHITPKRNLLRHGSFIRAGLTHKEDSTLNFTKGAYNQNLTTQLYTEDDPVVENANVLIGDLAKGVVLAEKYTLTVPFTKSQYDELISNSNKMRKFTFKNISLYGFDDDVSYNLNEQKAEFTLKAAGV